MSFIAVKGSLKQFCKDDYFTSKINDVVVTANKIMFEAYCFANLYILNCLKENKEIPVLNQTFFQKCCSMVSTFKDRKEMETKDINLLETFHLYKKLRPLDYNVAYRDNITIVLNYIAMDMEVAIINHLTLNFYKRFNKFLKLKYPDLTSEAKYQVCKGIYEKQYKGTINLFLNTERNLETNLHMITISRKNLLM